MTFFPHIQNWKIPKPAVTDSLREMAQEGALGNEDIVLWFGHRNNGRANITHLAALRGPGVVKEPDLLYISHDLINDVTDLTIELGVSLVGQIHSHGPGFGIGLSFTDRKYGIAVPHFLSVVAPHYAIRPNTRLEDCGIHVYEPSAGFRRFSPDEAKRRIEVVQSQRLPLLIVGKE
jgi:hypothetical protein